MAVKNTEKRTVTRGIVHIKATFSNTLVTITDITGNVIASSSGGTMRFRGSRKSTPYAAQVAVRDVIYKARSYGLREVSVQVKGPGAGRDAAIRSIIKEKLRITQIRDLTPLPHNGCRPPKKRRP